MPIYETLDTYNTEFRLLEILPGSKNDAIRCRLHKASLRRKELRYVALSYVWGKPDETRDVIINDEVMPVTKCLHHILGYLRSSGLLRFQRDDCSKQGTWPLWVDAICIDQKNILERNDQVAKMMLIYESAFKTIAWTGPTLDGESIQKLYGMTKSLIPPGSSQSTTSNLILRWSKRINNVIQVESAARAICAILDLSYWKRVWIIQELIASPTVQFLSDDSTAHLYADNYQGIKIGDPWKNGLDQDLSALQYCYSFIKILHDLITSHPFEMREFRQLEGYFQRLESGPLKVILESRAARMQGLQNKHLITQMCHLLNSKCTDGRDRIFGLGGVLEIGLAPDYALSKDETYFRFAKSCLERGIYEVLLYAGILNPSDSIAHTAHEILLDLDDEVGGAPSWAPDWTSIEGIETEYATVNENASFVYGWNSLRDCSANKQLPANQVSIFTGPHARISQELGYVLDGVLQVFETDSISSESHPDDEFSAIFGQLDWILGDLTGLDRYNYLGRILKTIFLGHEGAIPLPHRRYKLKDLTPILWVELRKYALDKEEYPYVTDEEWMITPVNEEDVEIFIVMFGKRMQINRVMETKESRLVLSPGLAEYGDLVCILFNCPFPVLLRQKDEHYILIGACFAEGLMTGEAADYAVEFGLNTICFDIT